MVHFEDKVNYLCQINNRCGIIWRINGVFHRENRLSTLSLGKGIFLTTRWDESVVLGYLLDESGIQAGHSGTVAE